MASSIAIESAATSGRGEDAYGICGDVFVLLDGAPGKAGEHSCLHDVRWYVRHLAAHLLNRAIQGGALVDCLFDSIEQLSSSHHHDCGSPRMSPSATVVLTRLQANIVEYLVLGDSFLVIPHPGTDPVVITDQRIRTQALNTYQDVRAAPIGSNAHAIAAQRHRDALDDLRNRAGGYWLASDLPSAATEALTGEIDMDGSRSLLLASDGLARLTFFGLSSWTEIIREMATGGAATLVNRLRSFEERDRLGVEWPRVKCSDDATGLLVTL